jgi:hypothetical protein
LARHWLKGSHKVGSLSRVSKGDRSNLFCSFILEKDKNYRELGRIIENACSHRIKARAHKGGVRIGKTPKKTS